MKEIKLKIIYVVAIVSFVLINTHALVWFMNICKPLSHTAYIIPPDFVEYSFMAMGISTLVMGIGNIFFIKRVGRETALFFLWMTLIDTLFIGLMVIITIVVFDLQEKQLTHAKDLVNIPVLIALYLSKQSLVIFFNDKRD